MAQPIIKITLQGQPYRYVHFLQPITTKPIIRFVHEQLSSTPKQILSQDISKVESSGEQSFISNKSKSSKISLVSKSKKSNNSRSQKISENLIELERLQCTSQDKKSSKQKKQNLSMQLKNESEIFSRKNHQVFEFSRTNHIQSVPIPDLLQCQIFGCGEIYQQNALTNQQNINTNKSQHNSLNKSRQQSIRSDSLKSECRSIHYNQSSIKCSGRRQIQMKQLGIISMQVNIEEIDIPELIVKQWLKRKDKDHLIHNFEKDSYQAVINIKPFSFKKK